MKTSTEKKAPSANIQAPEKFQTPNLNRTIAGLDWSFVFEVSLDVGAWNLELSFPRFYKSMTTQLNGIGSLGIMKTKSACLKNVAADVRRRKPARRCVLESASSRRRLRSGGILRHAVALMAVLLATATLAFAATNDLSSALQKGLFEEEANHNLDAAAIAYQAVAAQFDKDRKLAATAIFRLGEVYRKQGKTNEAAAQYERILKEFSDQTTLADLSRTLLPKRQVDDRKVEIEDISVRSAEDQEIQRIKAMIKDSSDLINAPSGNYGIPLQEAAKLNRTRVAEFLLANGADVNNPASNPPLHVAAEMSHKAMVELLIAHGADLNIRNQSFGKAPLHIASEKGFRTIAEILLKNKADVNVGREYRGSTPLHLATIAGNRAVAELLLEHVADINARDGSDSTPLMAAVINRKLEIAKFLIDGKADVNALNSEGYTALHIATQRNEGELVQLLLQNGANPELRIPKYLVPRQGLNSGYDLYGITPLHIAAREGNRVILEILLAGKANPNSTNSTGDTPLLYAASKGFVEIAEDLMKSGAAVDGKNNGGWTPLMYAFGNGKKTMVEVLLANKADPNTLARDGRSPLGLAKELSSPVREEITALLLKFGADENRERREKIDISRRAKNVRHPIFNKGTNSWSRFSLLEAFGMAYPNGGMGSNSPLTFPNLAKVIIYRLEGNVEREIPVDLEAILKSGDCSKDVWLEWGDVIEIPEMDHPLNESWQGFPKELLEILPKCLARTVSVSVKGATNSIALAPTLKKLSTSQNGQPMEWWGANGFDFWLNGVVQNSGLLRTSSDKTRVTVRRIDPATREIEERVFNLESVTPQNMLWLRDGDVIEIPERDPNAPAPIINRSLPALPPILNQK